MARKAKEPAPKPVKEDAKSEQTAKPADKGIPQNFDQYRSSK